MGGMDSTSTHTWFISTLAPISMMSEVVCHPKLTKKLESKLSQLRPENWVKRGSITQNQAKRIKEISYPLLFRDQAVEGSCLRLLV